MSLKKYYSEIYPFKEIYNFLQITPYRELSFVHDNTFFERYISITSLSHFRHLILDKKPSVINVGAFYNSIPKKGSNLQAISRELVFDVDVTDYDRTCECEKSSNRKKLCPDCFQIIKAAIGVLDYSMREQFGYKDILFVFSGGKGVHCWAMDKEAQDLTALERKGILGFLKKVCPKSVVKKNIINNMNKKPKSSEKLPIYFAEILKRFNVETKHYLVCDGEVTSNMKHLIKVPFSVHSNGNISVPINIREIDKLKLEDFPTLKDVLIDRSLLEPFLEIFRNFVERTDQC
ncbi:DNA primase small subunit [Cucumispora dikerogammari]|nr:DNA primase small subunit [Cucumispora dikerogammari]